METTIRAEHWLIQPFHCIITQAKGSIILNSLSTSTYNSTLKNMAEIEIGDSLMASEDRRGPDY
jgi:hypothetical protein